MNIVILIHELVTVRSFQNISSIQNSSGIFELLFSKGLLFNLVENPGGSKFSPGFDTFLVTDFRSSGIFWRYISIYEIWIILLESSLAQPTITITYYLPPLKCHNIKVLTSHTLFSTQWSPYTIGGSPSTSWCYRSIVAISPSGIPRHNHFAARARTTS